MIQEHSDTDTALDDPETGESDQNSNTGTDSENEEQDSGFANVLAATSARKRKRILEPSQKENEIGFVNKRPRTDGYV